MEKKNPAPHEKNKAQRLIAAVGKALRREKSSESNSESLVERKVRETVNLFALSEVQVPKRTLLVNKENSIDLLKEPSGTIYRIRVDSRHGFNDSNDPESFSAMFLISYIQDDEMQFFRFTSPKTTGDKRREFHVSPQDLNSIQIKKEQLQKTDFKIHELDEVISVMKYVEAAPIGIDIMQFGTPSKSTQKKEDERTQNNYGSVPGVVGA